MNTTIAVTDVELLQRVLMHRCSAPDAPYRLALGLEPDELAEVVALYLPSAAEGWRPGQCLGRHLGALAGEPVVGCCEREITAPAYGKFTRRLMIAEEADLCQLFLDHRSADTTLTVVFARLIARACMEPEHLWMCLGLRNRDELSAILMRHFRPLYDKNTANMRWKKFFYRILCDVEKVWMCEASACALCSHYAECFVEV